MEVPQPDGNINLEDFWDTYLSQTLPNYTLGKIKGINDVDENGLKNTYKTMGNIFDAYSQTTTDEILIDKYKTLKDECMRMAGDVVALTEDNKEKVQVFKSRDKLELVQFDKNLLNQDVIMHSVIDKENLEFKVKTNGNIVAFGEGDPFKKETKTEQEQIYERVNKMFNRLTLSISVSYYLVEFDGKDFTPIIFNHKDKYSTQKELDELYKELCSLPNAIVDASNTNIVDLTNVDNPVLLPIIGKLISKMIQCVLYKMLVAVPDMFNKNELYLMRIESIKRHAKKGAGRSMATIFPHNDQCLSESIDRVNCDLVSIIYYDIKDSITLAESKYTSAGFFFSEDIPNPLSTDRETEQYATSSTITDFIKYINIKPRLITNVPVKSGSYAIWRNSGKYLEPMSQGRKTYDGDEQLFEIRDNDKSFKYINPQIDFNNPTNIKNNIFSWHISPLNILNKLDKTDENKYYLDNYNIEDILSNINKGLTRLQKLDSSMLPALLELIPKQYTYKNKDDDDVLITSDNINKLVDDENYLFKCFIEVSETLNELLLEDRDEHNHLQLVILKGNYLGREIKKISNNYTSPFVDRNFMTVRRSPFNPFRTLRDLFHVKINVARESYNIIDSIPGVVGFNKSLMTNIKTIHTKIYGGIRKMVKSANLPANTPLEVLNNKLRAILYKYTDELYQNFLAKKDGAVSTYRFFIDSLCSLNKKINEILQGEMITEKLIKTQATQDVMEYKPADNEANIERYKHYQKYLKYKQKYIQLKNKLIARK